MTTVLQALNQGMHRSMSLDPAVVFLGEDILDPYGGAFKVAKGLSTAFPDRVFTSPISESAITGMATGLALRGLRPIVEIMFGDFMTLAFDQLLNHGCKYRTMYNQKARVPMVVRTPMGGRRGYGPTHSQSTEKFFLGIPGLRVIAPNTLTDPESLLVASVLHTEDPLLFVEHKLLYLAKLEPQRYSGAMRCLTHDSTSGFPVSTCSIPGITRPDLTIATYGYMADLAIEAAWRLAIEQEIFAEVVIPTELSPFDIEPILQSTARSGRLLTVEEGTLSLGWGSEVVSLIAASMPIKARRLGARDIPIPSSRPLEQAVLPAVDGILASASQLLKQ